MAQPNILYIHSHDCGRYIQPYGYNIPTPNLQNLAEEGTLFRQCYCSGPTCSPSRAAMLTGQSAHASGMTGLAHRGWSLNDYNQHIIHTLRDVGYTSALIGFQHIIDFENQTKIGYDEVVATPDGAAKAAEDYLHDPPDDPFFLSVGFTVTHRDYPEPSGVGAEDPNYCQPPQALPDTPETRYDMAAYKAAARQLDEKMGQVFDALEEAGLAENTLVICTTDHGIAFPRMKCTLRDGGTGVMLIMRGPDGFEGGTACDALISQIDIYPTICEYVGAQIPSWVTGSSFLPVIRGEREEINDAVFSEVNYHAAYEPQRCIRTKRYKYIARYGDQATHTVLPNCDDGPSKNLWVDNGWEDQPSAGQALYDLVFDPNEMNNLVDDPRYYPVLQDLQKRLHRWMEETDDPLLEGEVPAPSGALINDPSGESPSESPHPA